VEGCGESVGFGRKMIFLGEKITTRRATREDLKKLRRLVGGAICAIKLRW
jgi:hypothetical protein